MMNGVWEWWTKEVYYYVIVSETMMNSARLKMVEREEEPHELYTKLKDNQHQQTTQGQRKQIVMMRMESVQHIFLMERRGGDHCGFEMMVSSVMEE
jgi:hypothetical protein